MLSETAMNLRLLIYTLFFWTITAVAQTPGSDFRGDFRPAFGKSLTVAVLKERLNSNSPVVIDVRLEEDFLQNPNLIPGAIRKNPEKLALWISTLDKD